MSLQDAAVAVAVPILVSITNKLLTGQPVTREDADAATRALAPFVTSHGAALAEAGVELAQDAVYGRSEGDDG